MPEPLAGAGVPPWRTALTAALHRAGRSPEHRYLQFATTSPDGTPRNRTVVFRGFGPASEILVLTDRRSRKVDELLAQPQASLCWYLASTREQFRLEAHCILQGAGAVAPWADLRTRLWQERGARGQAEWLGAVPAAALNDAVDDFLLLVCAVQHVEHLQLRTDPHSETHYTGGPGPWETRHLRGAG